MALSQKAILTPGCLSIPIEKFSHSSSAPTNSNYQWIHESKRDDLFFVFRNVRVQASGFDSDQESLMMSISAGGNILEQQDVSRLVEMTQKFDSMLQTMALNTARIEAPVQIVVKRPCIAMRYTKDPTKVQRIQVRFKRDQDYDKSLDIFRNLGLPIKDAPQTVLAAPNAHSLPEVATPKLFPSVVSTSNLYAAQIKDSTPEHTAINLSSASTSTDIHRHRSTSSETLRSMSLAPMPNLYAAQTQVSSPENGTVDLSSMPAPRDTDHPRSASSETLRPSNATPQMWLHPDRLMRSFSTYSSPSMSVSAIPVPTPTSTEKSINESSLYVSQMRNQAPHTGSPVVLHREASQEPKPQFHNFQAPYQSSLPTSMSPNLSGYNNAPTTMSSSYISPVQNNIPQQSMYKKSAPSPNINNQGAEPKPMPPIYVSQMQGQDGFQKASGASPSPSPLMTSASSASAEPAAVLAPRQIALKLGRTLSSIHPNPSGSLSLSSPVVRNNSLPSHPGQDGYFPRPQSVPIGLTLHESDWVPPRRELPFLKGRANSKSRTASAEPVELPQSVPISIVKETTPAPSSTPVASKKAARRVAQRNTKKQPVVQDSHGSVPPDAPIQDNILATIPEEESLTTSKSSTALDKVVSTKRSFSVMESQPVEAKRQKMIDQSTQTQTLSGRDHTTAFHFQQDNTGTVTPEVSKSPQPAPPPNILNQIDEYVASNKSRPAPIEIFQTPRYGEASEEDRRAIVNDWICDNLESEDFLRLCEDVEQSWRRIGLGF